MRRPLGAVAAGLAVAAALAACTDGSPAEKGSNDGGPSYVLGEGDQYVALGDSYTAAPGTGPVSRGGGCGQTRVDYPHRIAQATGVTLDDRSCSGAETASVTGPQELPQGTSRPPQIQGVTPETDLVTFRLGANDFGLIGRTFTCAQSFAAGTVQDRPHACAILEQISPAPAAADVLDDLAEDVRTALEAIVDRAPDARLVVIGYPQILPPTGTCDLFPLPAGDDNWARGILAGINIALRDGAEAVGATFINMADASDGHDTCSDDPWMAGLRATRGDAIPFHPYPAEGQEVARLVLAELES